LVSCCVLVGSMEQKKRSCGGGGGYGVIWSITSGSGWKVAPLKTEQEALTKEGAGVIRGGGSQ